MTLQDLTAREAAQNAMLNEALLRRQDAAIQSGVRRAESGDRSYESGERSLSRAESGAAPVENGMFRNLAVRFDPRNIPKPTDMTAPDYAGNMWLYLRQQGHSSRAIADAMKQMGMAQRIADAQRDKYIGQFQAAQTPQERDLALAMMSSYAPAVAKTLAPRTPSYLQDWMQGRMDERQERQLAQQKALREQALAQQLELANARLAARSGGGGGGRSGGSRSFLNGLANELAYAAYNQAKAGGASDEEAAEEAYKAASAVRFRPRNAKGEIVDEDGLTKMEQEAKNLLGQLLDAARAGNIGETGDLLDAVDVFLGKNRSKLDKDDIEAINEHKIVANYLREKALAEQTYKGEGMEQLLAKNPNMKMYRDEIPLETKMRYGIY